MSRCPLAQHRPREAAEHNQSDSLTLESRGSPLTQVRERRPLCPTSIMMNMERFGRLTPRNTWKVDRSCPRESIAIPRDRLFKLSPHSILNLEFEDRVLVRKLDFRIRVSRFQLEVHRRNVSETIRLDPGSRPHLKRERRPLWPSSPTLTEWLEMTRHGASPCDEGRPAGTTVRVSRRVQMQSISLTKRIVSNHIIGVRSDVEVPQKFLGYFRYREGFLFLTAPYSLPSGLARFLVSTWVRDPHSLWLKWFGTLKQYLRTVPAPLLKGTESEWSDTLLVEESDSD